MLSAFDRWLFNWGADIYAWFTGQAAWRASCARMAARLKPPQRSVVLDLGCGPGVSTFELARHLPGSHLIGLDIAPRMLAQARRRARAQAAAASISWLLADAACLPLTTASVDALTAHSFLYLVPDRASVLAEARRALRPGGKLVLFEPNARPASLRRVLAVSRDIRHVVSIGLWRPFSRVHGRFTPDSLRACLEGAGFVRCGVEETFGGLALLAWAEQPCASPRSA